jgi:adenosylcobinamide kinase / adenosylcobinamide-phosphate guanylyltransferase
MEISQRLGGGKAVYFVTGGAFNGKAEWVKGELLRPDDISFQWHSHFRPEDVLLYPGLDTNQDIIVFEGLEYSILHRLMDKTTNGEQLRKEFTNLFLAWMKWEQEKDKRLVIWIGSDITKGIVPLEEKNRLWRDISGWVYQDLAKISENVVSIWYGIPTTLK